MPQSERAEVLKKIMRWLAAQEKGATLPALRHQIKWEITAGGATDTTIRKYIEDLHGAELIDYEHPMWTVTNNGKMWLERHCI